MQLKEIETKLQSSRQTLLELNYKKRTARERAEVLKKELGDVTPAQIETRKKELEVESATILKRVEEISNSLKTVL